jgi:hypothetical protein
MFQKPNLFSSSGEGREKTALLGPLETANLNYRTTTVKVKMNVMSQLTDNKPMTRFSLLSGRCRFVDVGRPL